MIEMKKISVIMPVYKVDVNAFRTCLKSIVSQDYPFIEILIVFDGTPSKELVDIVIAEKHKKTIKYYIKKHSGVSEARNYGIDRMTGEWCLFVDADDSLKPHALCSLYSNSSNSILVVGGFEKKEKKRRTTIYTFDENIISSNIYIDIVLSSRPGAGTLWNKLFCSSIIHANKLRFNSDLAISEDAEFIIRFLLSTQGCVSLTKNVVYEYHYSSGSSATRFHEDYYLNILKAIETVQNDLGMKSNTQFFYDYVLFHVLLIQQHYIFNMDNKWTDYKKREKYNEIRAIPIIDRAFELSEFYGFDFKHRIALLAYKYNIYELSKFISLIRERQLN